MFFGEAYLHPKSQVQREEGWLVFRYTEDQWRIILKEIGDVADVRVLRGDFELSVRQALEVIAIKCLDAGTPEQQRAYHDDRKKIFRERGRVFLQFADALRALGYEGDDLFELEDAKSRFTVTAIQHDGEVFSRIAQRMEDTESVALIGSLMPRPRGPADQSRKEYLEEICRLWQRNLGRKAQSSVTPEGKAAGPMVRFLMACCNPVLTIRKTALLTPDGARSEIRSYVNAKRQG